MLQVTDTLGVGGAETWLIELLRHWHRTGHVRMDFLLTSGNKGVFDDEAARLGAGLHYIKYSQTNIAMFAARFRQILHNGHYDAVHDHQDYAGGWHLLLGYGALPPVRVIHVHNPWLYMEANYAVGLRRKLVARAGKRLIQSLATNVCGTSREALDQYGFLLRGDRPAVSVVHCGIAVEKFCAESIRDRQDVRQEFQWEPGVKIVLFVGRLDRALDIADRRNHKNSWLAVNVVRNAISHDPQIRLLMAGDGQEQRKEIESRISSWGLGRQLRLIGVRHDVDRLMRASDVLLFPSRQEGLGMAAVEAQAAGLPVLASDAVPDECIVLPGLYRTASLQDSIEVWSAALRDSLRQPRLPLSYCREAVEKSAFSIKNSACHLERIYSAHMA